MATFVVAHGAWSGGWSWKKVREMMSARGHQFVTPTYTGLGDRAHLAHPDIDLEAHIADVLAVLEFEDLNGVNLVGHSYGGMVATGVADRARSRIAQLVYVDAFVPDDGESLYDLLPAELRAQRQASVGSDWRIPPSKMSPDSAPEDVAWCTPRRVPLPAKTFAQKLKFQNGPLTLPRHYVYCTRISPEDRFRRFYERAKREGWGAYEIDSSHSAQVTNPAALAELFDRVAV